MTYDNNSSRYLWKGQQVVKVQQAADFYDVPYNNIRMNFNNNKDKFIEDEHFFKLQGNDLKLFKDESKNFSVVDFGRINTLFLFTRKGMARLAKSCGSEQAWTVYEELENSYFNTEQNQIPDHSTSLRGWADEIDKNKRLNDINREQQQLLVEQQSAVDFTNAVKTTDGSILVRELAKLIYDTYDIKIGQNRLYDWLVDNKYLMRKGSGKTFRYEPYQRYMDYFDICELVVSPPGKAAFVKSTVKVSGKGQTYFIPRIIESLKDGAA